MGRDRCCLLARPRSSIAPFGTVATRGHLRPSYPVAYFRAQSAGRDKEPSVGPPMDSGERTHVERGYGLGRRRGDVGRRLR
jgi:hypothetical protein